MSLPPIVNGESSPASLAPTPANCRGRYAFVSLGCPKNVVDSERMLHLLQSEGYQLVGAPDGADFVVVNTCGFIEEARQESYAAIDAMLQLKRRCKTGGVIVAGCLAERQRESLLDARPDIDLIVGVFGREEIAQAADRLMGRFRGPRAVLYPPPACPQTDCDRRRITPEHFAYLKVSEGCNRLCSFCAIPQIRGRHASKPMEEVVREAEQLAASGARELVVVAQDTTYYGLDLYGEPRLAALSRALCQVDGVDWIRLMYLYPIYFTEELIETIAHNRKILPYLDIPLQHINDDVLRRMARRVTRRQIEVLLDQLRSRVPELVLRSTLIAGFPGETESQFEELLDFVARRRFERLGVFVYSAEQGTPAAEFPDQLSEEVKSERRERLMAVQQQIAFQWNAAQIGRRIDVILDRPAPGEENVWIGRSKFDAPDVDGVVYVTGGSTKLTVGAIAPCEIAAYQGYDLAGVVVGEPY